jgi:hypothetical protein
MSAVDTVHEYAGYGLAGLLQEILSGWGIPLLVALGGTARLVLAMAERGTPRDLAVHALGLVLVVWLTSLTSKESLPAPRLAVWTGAAADAVQRRAARTIRSDFLEDPFGWERLAATASLGRIYDPALARDVDGFLESCAKTALASTSTPTASPNLLRPGVLRYGPRCETWREELWARLREHLLEDARHARLRSAAERRSPGEASAFIEAYADQVVARAVDEPGSPTSEAALVAASLGEYRHFDPAQSTGGASPWAAAERPRGLIWDLLGAGVDGGVSVLAGLRQAWESRFAAKQAYYLVVSYGPHLYGLTLMAVLGFFPAAGLWALLPGRWTALVNWGKVFVSVKLWPVGWAALSAFNARRGALEALDPPGRGAADVFLGVAAMYLLVPSLAWLMVHLGAAAAAAPFASAIPPAAGAGYGAAGRWLK